MKIGLVLVLAAICVACGGYGSQMASTPQPGVVPTIVEISPANTNAGGPGLMLTVNGTGFGSTSLVKWNGSQQTTTFVSGNQLTATIPASAIATPGAVPITVMNPGTPGSGGIYGNGGTAAETSTPVTFTVE